MIVDRGASRAADSGRSSASGNSITRRDSMMLAAAGLTAPLPPTVSFAATRKERHGITWTRAEEINVELVRFLA